MCCKSKRDVSSVLKLSCIRSTRKVVIIGECGVGKSTLIIRYLSNEFEESHHVTIGGAFVQLNVEVGSKAVTLDIWDTAGQEKYRSLMTLYFRQAVAAVVAYDITNIDTFRKCYYWIEAMKEIEPKCKLFLVGTKSDGIRQVSETLAQQFADRFDMRFVETSSKNGKNVEVLFKLIGKFVLNKEKKERKALAA